MDKNENLLGWATEAVSNFTSAVWKQMQAHPVASALVALGATTLGVMFGKNLLVWSGTKIKEAGLSIVKAPGEFFSKMVDRYGLVKVVAATTGITIASGALVYWQRKRILDFLSNFVPIVNDSEAIRDFIAFNASGGLRTAKISPEEALILKNNLSDIRKLRQYPDSILIEKLKIRAYQGDKASQNIIAAVYKDESNALFEKTSDYVKMIRIMEAL